MTAQRDPSPNLHQQALEPLFPHSGPIRRFFRLMTSPNTLTRVKIDTAITQHQREGGKKPDHLKRKINERDDNGGEIRNVCTYLYIY